jgi:hypothetical protein
MKPIGRYKDGTMKGDARCSGDVEYDVVTQINRAHARLYRKPRTGALPAALFTSELPAALFAPREKPRGFTDDEWLRLVCAS